MAGAGKITLFLLMTCIAAATGGLIFGFDVGISGGVTSMDSFLVKFFPDLYSKEETNKSTNTYCKFDSVKLTLFTSSIYPSSGVTSLFAFVVTRMLGRKWSMFGGGIIFLAGAAINSTAVNFATLIVGRILLGVGVGFANLELIVHREGFILLYDPPRS